MALTSRRIAGTLIAIIAGGVAAALEAGAANSLMITLLVELVVLHLSSDDERQAESRELISAVTVAQELSDHPKYRELLRSLVQDLARVQDAGHPLFERQAYDRLVAFVDAIRELSGGRMVITDSREIQMEGIWALEHLGSELFATSVVSMDTFWTTRHGPEYHRKNLEIVQKGRAITRVFILDSQDALKDVRLRELLREQSDAGVDVWFVTADKLPPEAIIDFGIWDKIMVCTLRPSPSSPGEVLDATYDTTPAGRQRGDQLRQLIMHAAEQLETTESTSNAPSRTVANEDLEASAPQMRALAKERCVGGYLDPDSCCWYHEAWQYLRLLRLVETPRLHETFFRHYLEKYIATMSAPRILVAGLADYEMYAVVLDALGSGDTLESHVTVLDVCDTPLRNTDWFAAQRNTRVLTRRADAAETGLPSCSFDMVITDAFLTKLPEPKRRAVVDEWHRILAEGGQVLTTVKLGSGGEDGVRADSRQVAAYAARAREGAKRIGGITPDEVEGLARSYAEHNISFPIAADADVERLFVGFDVSVLEVTPVSEYAVSYYAQVIGVKLNG
jgi:hypothetical protein